MASTASFYGTNHGFQLGYNSGTIGPITIENHLPPERPETPPPPSSTVPFRRDPDFVDRGTLLDRILEKGSASPSRIALVGLGGVGKSQLVIEYSYQVRDRSPDTWVFWVHTSNAARFEQSYREIADRVKIPGRKDPKTNIFNLVSEWLHNEGKGKWMLILDSIDDDRFLHEIPLSSRDESDSRIPAQPLFNYLPLNAHGSIIITTRSRGVAAKMVEDGDIIAVESMDQIHAQTLFEKKLGKQENQEDIIELIAALEFMPLAIVQAAAYIKQRAPRSSVKQYLTEFQKNDYRKMSLLDYKGGQLRRDQEAKNSIILTWQISFNHLRQERPTAADLLSLMSFFDGHGIAEFLLYDRNQKGTNHDSMENETSDKDEISAVDSDVNDQFEEDIVTLRNFSFISVNMDGASFGMHGLVQLAMQKWLETNGQHEQWKQQFIQNLSKEFPKPEYRNWEKCELIFPHAQSAVAQLPHTDNLLEEWALLLNNAALFALSKGNIIEAEKMAVNVMKATKEKLGSEHESTLSSTNMVGLVLDRQGKYKEAEAMHRHTLAAREKMLGVDHLETLISLGNLAVVLDRQGKYKEAEAMHRQALATREKVLGVDHLDTLISMSNLSLVLNKQGKYEEAEAIHRQTLAARERILGVDHPNTLTSIGNLGLILNRQKKYKEAEAMNRQALAGFEKVLGVDHPDTLTSRSILGFGLYMQEKYEEAEAMHRQALAGYNKVLGVDHPNTQTSIGNLGLVLDRQGKYEEAEVMHRQALAGFEKVLGVDHPNTLTSMDNLSLVLERQGKYKEAEAMHRQALAGYNKVLGADHPDTLASLSSLGTVLERQGKYEEAEEMNQQALATREKVLGVDHPNTLASMDNLSLVLERQGKYEEAEVMYQRVLAGYKKVLGADHPNTLASLSNLGMVLYRQGKYKEAEAMHRQALEVREKVLGVDHPNTLTSMSNLSLVLDGQGKYEEAEPMHRQALAGYEKVLGVDHAMTLMSMRYLSVVLKKQGRRDEALEVLHTYIQLQQLKLGPDHPDTISATADFNDWQPKHRKRDMVTRFFRKQ
ncbi:hypothetical protein EYB25_006448 [Talaromyces marneffei]|nr:hypothetical protein EYB25_006448 [Talaromyces marneffei]